MTGSSSGHDVRVKQQKTRLTGHWAWPWDTREKFGEQSFDFHRVGPTLFSAEKRLAPDEGPAQQISYWVSMNDAGRVDYVMSCLRVETVQGCSSRFLLSRNLASVTISLSKDATSARAAFEDLRGQIRSYLISPDLDTK
jgi:hypothetical protein